MMGLIFPVLSLCLSTLNAQSLGPQLFCSTGRPVTPLVDVPFDEVYRDQPFTIVVSELSEKIRAVDNICFAYLKTQRNDTFIGYDVRTGIDGSLQSSPTISLDGGSGVNPSSSATCTFIDQAFAAVDECQLFAIYRFFVSGYCKNDRTSDNIRDNEVYAFTYLNNTTTDYCRNRILQTFADYGFGDRSYYFYPRKRPSRCVSAQLCSIPSRSLPDYPAIHY